VGLAERVTDRRAFTIALPTAEECSVLFSVVDVLVIPLEGASVSLNGLSGTTDHQGSLLFSGLALKTYGWSTSLANYVTQNGQIECTEAITYEVNVTLLTGMPPIKFPWVLPASLISGLLLVVLGYKT